MFCKTAIKRVLKGGHLNVLSSLIMQTIEREKKRFVMMERLLEDLYSATTARQNIQEEKGPEEELASTLQVVFFLISRTKFSFTASIWRV